MAIDGGGASCKGDDTMARKDDEKARAELKVFAARLAKLLQTEEEAHADDRRFREKFAVDVDASPLTLKSYRLALREPGMLAAARLARRLGVSIDYLAGLTDDPTPYPAPRAKKKASSGGE